MSPRPLAVVTGASSGIGRALALRLAQGGYDLALISRDTTRLEESAARCRALGARARAIAEDLSDPGAAQRVFQLLDGLAVDALVNNAGFGLHGDFAATDGAAEAAMVRVHITAVLELTKLF